MTGSGPVVRKKTYELVADRLTAEIGERRLRPGDALPTERQLTQEYRIGRSSVREALRMLESQGLIESRGSGMFVVAEFRNPLDQSLHLLLSLDESNLRELYEMRKLLEGELAALAAERRTDEDLGRMLTALQEMQDGLDSEDVARAAPADPGRDRSRAPAGGPQADAGAPDACRGRHRAHLRRRARASLPASC